MGMSRLVKEGRGWFWKVYLSPERSWVGLDQSRKVRVGGKAYIVPGRSRFIEEGQGRYGKV